MLRVHLGAHHPVDRVTRTPLEQRWDEDELSYMYSNSSLRTPAFAHATLRQHACVHRGAGSTRIEQPPDLPPLQ